MAKQNEIESPAYNIISAGTKIEGDFITDGSVRIDGQFTGNIHAGGKLVLGRAGSIKGVVICQAAEIEGRLDANVQVKDLFSLKSTSYFVGDVVADRIAIEQGAFFAGNCKMPPSNPENEKII